MRRGTVKQRAPVRHRRQAGKGLALPGRPPSLGKKITQSAKNTAKVIGVLAAAIAMGTANHLSIEYGNGKDIFLSRDEIDEARWKRDKINKWREERKKRWAKK